MLGTFQKSDNYTVGVELELQLINPNSFDLVPVSQIILEKLDKTSLPSNHYTPEMTNSMIEINTSVHSKYADLLLELQQIRDVVINTCSESNVLVSGGGTHPFQCWTERTIFDKQRYKDLYQRYGYLAKRFTVFGQHVHIGCKSGDEALYLLHALNRFVPQFIALSSSSPFVRGVDTFFDSARLNSVFAFPLSGYAPFILDWDTFDKEYFSKMERTGTINNMKDFYWDIRPKPEYGTLELRVCDTPLSITKAATIAIYLQVLCKYLLEEKPYFPEVDDYLVYNYNRFQACRFGLDGEVVHPKTMQKILLRDDIMATVNLLEKHAIELDAMDAMQNILKFVSEDNDANYLREKFIISDKIEDVVLYSVNRLKY